MKTRDARSLSSSAQEELRRRAVKAVLEGKSQSEAAKIFGVSRQTVNEWVQAYRKAGEKALRAKRKGRPYGGSLDSKQERRMAKIVIDKRPNQLKLPFYLWTREAVGQMIKQKLGIELSVWTVGRYLKRWGFTPQKPIRRAYERSDFKVQRWLKEEYPAIKKQAALEKAEIFWADEMGLRSDHTSGKTYGRKGHTPVVPITGDRFSCNMISALTNRGTLYFMVFKDRFKTEVFLDFLRRLIRQAQQKVFLIVDGHPVHRAKKVKRWLEKHKDRICMFFLPPYSPELNPDEYLNNDVKSNAVGRKRAGTLRQMLRNVRRHLRSRQKTPAIVRNFFRAPNVKYAA
jgi:transposase